METNIKLVVRVIIDAVELIKNNFEIREEVRNFFLGTDYYTAAIRNEMMERGVVNEYLDLFDCADPKVLFDKYMTVHEEKLEFDYAEAAEGYDRAKCYFKVPCDFDTLGYINAMYLMNRESDKENADYKDAAKNGKVLVDVYTETTSPDLAGADGISHIEVDKDLLFKWFKEVILPDFRSTSDRAEGLSDEAIFEDWLNEYLPEATVGLCQWLDVHKDKEYYINCYNKTYDRYLEEAKKNGSVDSEDTANEMFDKTATVEEVVGNYLVYHGDYAFSDWMENLTFYTERSKEKQEEFPPIKRKQDAEVTRILSKLCNQIWVSDIAWDVPNGAKPSGKLSDSKVVPYVQKADVNEVALEIQSYLYEEYGFKPKSFKYCIDGEIYECAETLMLGISKITWYVPDEMKAPSFDGPCGTYTVEAPSMDKFHADDIYTERVRIELMEKFGFTPISFQYVRPDGRMASYRNRELSDARKDKKEKDKLAAKELANIYLEKYGAHDALGKWNILAESGTHAYSDTVQGILSAAFYEATTYKKANEGVGCYGVGSEPCLTHCKGCDCKYEVKLLQFEEQMKYENNRNSRFDISDDLPFGPATKEEVKDYLIQDYSTLPYEMYIFHGTEVQVKQKFIANFYAESAIGYTLSDKNGVVEMFYNGSEKAVYVATPLDSLKKYDL